jgi:hypothetical protein
MNLYVCKVYIGDASSIPKEQASGYHQMTKKGVVLAEELLVKQSARQKPDEPSTHP